MMAAGGAGGTHSLRRPRKDSPGGERRHCFPHLELVEGKIVCDDAASEPSVHR